MGLTRTCLIIQISGRVCWGSTLLCGKVPGRERGSVSALLMMEAYRVVLGTAAFCLSQEALRPLEGPKCQAVSGKGRAAVGSRRARGTHTPPSDPPPPSGQGLLPCSSQAQETSPEALSVWKGQGGKPTAHNGQFPQDAGADPEGQAVMSGQLWQ